MMWLLITLVVLLVTASALAWRSTVLWLRELDRNETELTRARLQRATFASANRIAEAGYQARQSILMELLRRQAQNPE